MNRVVHRVGAIVAVLLMLWLGGTGSWMQLLDLKTVLSHASPDTDPTALSMVEGMWGPGNFTVIQLSDFKAAALSKDFDINAGMQTVLQAVRAPRPLEGDANAAVPENQFEPITWIELRVVDGMPIGQVMAGTALEAFNARTGVPVTAVPQQQLPQGRLLPYSLRQKLKTLHRFWNRDDRPGVFFEFLAGLVLWTLLITGLVMYFKLLSARARSGRRQWFWLTGGTWRGLHRSISVLAAVFLMCIAFSGTWIGFESSWSAFHRGGGVRTQSSLLPVDEVQSLTATTVQAMQRLHPDTPIKAIRLRTVGQMKQGVVITGGEQTDQLLFDAGNGQPASLTEPAYPKSNFPFGVQVHENIKHFHSGEMFGISGQLMNLFAGSSLLFLSISGLIVYFDMWSKRKKIGRKGFVWAK
jgi:uncharacterized iron-regulated membrane protein